MNIQEYILSSLPVFSVVDKQQKVLDFFEKSAFSHIAVTENDVFVGLLSADDTASFEANAAIGDLRFQMEAFFVTPDTQWLDVLEKFSRNEANILPVLDANANKVIGYYDLNDVVTYFISTPFFIEPGGILVVSKGVKDYSLSEVAQIVESNNGKLLGAFITESKNDMVQVTLKISSGNLNEFIQTFRRYSYNIIFGNNDDQFLEDLKERSAYLEKYLNV